MSRFTTNEVAISQTRGPANRGRARAIWLRWIDPKFTRHPQAYVAQSLLAGLTLTGILLAESSFTNGVIVIAIGASVACVFFTPHTMASSPARIVGGHAMGVLAAYAAHAGVSLLAAVAHSDAYWLAYVTGGVALALVILFMTVTGTEHIPATATAIGLVADDVPIDAVVFILSAAVLTAVLRKLIASRLRDLV